MSRLNNNVQEIEKLLNESRKKLLDITLRNSLLNYNLKRKRRLIIVDELPNIIFKRLYQGDEMKLIPVPYPEVEEDNNDEASQREVENSIENELEKDEATGFVNAKIHAKRLGINTNEEVHDLQEDPTSSLPSKHTDNNLQTLHYPDDLARIVRNLKSKANTAIQETGSNLLYLAIGFLKWKPSVNSEKVIYAPLILLPVHLERGSPDKKTGVYFYKIGYTDEDLFSNISLQHKIRQDFGIELPSFDESQSPEEYFTKVEEICENKNELLGVSRRFALDFFHFSKLLMYLDLDPKNWSITNSILHNKVLSEISGDVALDDNALSFEKIPEDKTEDMGLVLDADASQRDAIAQVLKGHNLIIEGPPGTGKSQTIANLIAVALSEGKSILFVAEKLVALEVVKKRLDAIGLGDFVLELHSHKSNKASFYSSLRDRLNLEVSISNNELKNNIELATKIKSTISEYLSLLHTPYKDIGITPYIIFGETLNRFEEEFKHLPHEEKYLQIDQKKMEELSLDLRALMSAIEEDPEILNSPWAGFTATSAISLDSETLVNLFQRLQLEFQNISEVFEQSEFTNSIPKTQEVIESINNLIDSKLLFQCPDKEYLNALDGADLEQVKRLIDSSKKLMNDLSIFDRVDLDVIETLEDLSSLSRTLRGFKDLGFFGRFLNKEYKNARKKFFMICTKDDKMSAGAMSDTLNEYKEKIEDFILRLKQFYLEGAEKITTSMGEEIVDANTLKALPESKDIFLLLQTLEKPIEWKEKLNELGISESLMSPLYTDRRQEYIDILQKFLFSLKDSRNNLSVIENEIQHFGKINESHFYKDEDDYDVRSSLLKMKVDHANSLGLWIDVSRLLDKFQGCGFGSVIEFAQDNSLILKIKELAEYGFYREWAHKIIRENTLLATFDRYKFESFLKTFRKIDSDIGSLFAKEHALQLSKNATVSGVGGKVSDKTEMQLIRNEVRKQKRHIPIRQTLKRASKSIRALKPCFMMSPLSVAQFIDPSQEPFDLMIMDEASQIFPEDALGAIARSKQVVVVGDPNQLPPTSFFKGNPQEEDEAEETMATTAESILDMMLRVYPNVKRLKWHYRSRHESLIAFSNYHFYDGELMIFPSPDGYNSHIGIKRKFLPNGYYRDGQNFAEAIQMVNDACEHLKNNPNESLGIVAMNKKQTELIDKLLEEKTKEDIHIRHLLDDADRSGKFFIKNLENVQGDEADTLYIGTTYGPDPKTKKVYQRFGPINGEYGWRRMNVLITRARNKIVVYTSLRSSDIAISEGNRGRMALRHYLEYIESGHVESVQGTHTGKQPDSPFEESVIKYIRSLGYIAKPQVGVAGFFIDIGVKVEGSYNFILGVECDGAGYHSSKSARDRDRIRQDILESMGWHIHRIWSTDWFKHRNDEEERLKKVLQKAKQRAIVTDKESEIVEYVEQEVVQVSRIAEEEEGEISEDIKTISDEKEDKPLKAILKEFRDTNITSKYTMDYSSILSDRMIELLSETKPTTMEEFRLQIPLYLREKIDSNQMEYIDDIFSIIENRT